MRPLAPPTKRGVTHTAGTIWLTGLSASGKSTLGRALLAGLRAAAVEPVVFIDSEEFRHSLGGRLGHSLAERFEVLRLLVAAARQHNDAGQVVVLATISHRLAMRAYARREIPRFMEVYLDCPVEICAARDDKGQYARAFNGEYACFVGVTEPYERSLKPDLVVDTASHGPQASLDELLPEAIAFLYSQNRNYN